MTQFTRWQDFQRTPASARQQQLGGLRKKVHQFVIEQLGPLLSEGRVDDAELRTRVHEQLNRALAEESLVLSAAERAQVIQDTTDDILGYGPIDRLIRDPEITEVMVNGPKRVYVERHGKIEQAESSSSTRSTCCGSSTRSSAQVGRRIDESTPMVDARLPDGSRVNAVIPPLAIDGPYADHPQVLGRAVHRGRPHRLRHAVGRRWPTSCDACVRGRLNIVVSGGTGTGKTTLLNVLSSFIPGDERIVTIEDAAELQLQQEHVVRSGVPAAEHRGQGRGDASATWSATPCACAPTASSSARSAAARPSTCSRP